MLKVGTDTEKSTGHCSFARLLTKTRNASRMSIAVFKLYAYNITVMHIELRLCTSGAFLGQHILGAWPLIICDATTGNRNYYRTN